MPLIIRRKFDPAFTMQNIKSLLDTDNDLTFADYGYLVYLLNGEVPFEIFNDTGAAANPLISEKHIQKLKRRLIDLGYLNVYPVYCDSTRGIHHFEYNVGFEKLNKLKMTNRLIVKSDGTATVIDNTDHEYTTHIDPDLMQLYNSLSISSTADTHL